MKIIAAPESAFLAVSNQTIQARAPTMQRVMDRVSLEELVQAKALLRQHPDNAGEVDLGRVAAAAAVLQDGNYQVKLEKVADAILEDLGWVGSWLADQT